MRPTVYYTTRPEPFDSPLILRLSKDERLAQDRPVEGRASRSWFDKLTTSVYAFCSWFDKLTTSVHAFCSWFDKLTTSAHVFCPWFGKLTTSVYVLIVRTHQISAHAAVPD